MVNGMRNIYVALTVMLLLVSGPVRSFAAAREDPALAVAMLQKAIDTRDMALAETYLDLDAVVKKAVDVAVADESVLREAGKDPATAIVIALGSASGANDSMREMFASEAKEYVRHGVVSGAFAGRVVEGASVYRGIFGKAFRGGEKDKKSFGPVRVIRRGKNEARLATSLVSGTKGKAYPLELALENKTGAWRIVEIVNMPALIRQSMSKGKK